LTVQCIARTISWRFHRPIHVTLSPANAPFRLLLDIWDAASRNAALSETLPRIAANLARVVAADSIAVRRIDPGARRLETVSSASIRPSVAPGLDRDVLEPAELEELLAWARRGAAALVRHAEGGHPALAAIPRALALHGESIVAPLSDGDAPAGVFVIGARLGRFTDAHIALADELIGPLSAALQNDTRRLEFSRLREALEADKRALLQRLDRDHLGDAIVGGDSGLKQVMERVEQVAPTDAPVLLFGETGSGKEVVARAIHTRSRRAGAPIVRVNCGALPAGLIDSELFGHEKGSFTGAIATRKGWFERADGGTLFLDEIGELPLDAQVRLLRILQDGTFERVGGHRPLAVDVRVVAATHRNLRDMVTRGTFREDLWYRIGVFPIEIPPLRSRPEDIPSLAAHFAMRAGMRMGGAPLSLAPEDIDALVAYSWPGNVRELASVIERAAILGDGRRLRVAAALGTAAATPRAGGTLELAAQRPIETLDEAIVRHIERALRATGGRIEGPRGAAAVLRINPHTLRARMRKLRIDWGRFRDAGAMDEVSDPHFE
jgi:transcriptional regulator with GAF, ATPase, and Fis domain